METARSATRIGPGGIESLIPPAVENRLKAKITELSRQPEFQWHDGELHYAVEPDGTPMVRAAVADSDLTYDLWKDVRNPATVGLYPLGFPEIWDFYANNRKRRTDESGRTTIFQTAETFKSARGRYRRAVVIATMIAAAPEVFARYNRLINDGSVVPWDGYRKVWDELNNLLDQGITRLAMDLVGDGRAVVVMNQANAARISKEATPVYHQDASHGVCKGGNFPARSIAVLTGLGQFGVSRNVFRDEEQDGSLRRLCGPIRCIVVFDENEALESSGDEVLLLTEEWREKVRRLSDFTNTDPQVNRYRFCPYIAQEGESGCAKCLAACPSGALPNSSPLPSGSYSTSVAGQRHRFWEGALQFDNGKCLEYRQQHSALYGEWMCGRCLSICGGDGRMRESAVRGNRELR